MIVYCLIPHPNRIFLAGRKSPTNENTGSGDNEDKAEDDSELPELNPPLQGKDNIKY